MTPSAEYTVNDKTEPTPFYPIPAQQSHLFLVHARIDALHALSTADSLEEFVMDQLRKGVQGTIEPCESFALDFLLSAARALRHSLGLQA